MRSVKAFLLSIVFAWLFSAACGGGGGGSTPSPSPSPTPSPSQDPCAGISLEADEPSAAPSRSEPVGAEQARPAGPKLNRLHGEGHHRWNVLDLLWKHRAAMQQLERRGLAEAPPRANVDVGEIAVLQDEGDLVLVPNTFDLKSSGLRFTRTSDGGYQVAGIDGTFRSPLGDRLTLTDDDTRQVALRFALPFYAGSHNVAFVNSDGNITFEEGDNASTERNVSRFLTGPPRAALFFADLDPSVGGRVFARAESDVFLVTWCNVRGFDSTDIATIQLAMFPDGTIEMKHAASTTLGEAVVGLSPGRTANFNPVDLSAGGATAAPNQAIGERFGQRRELDLVALARQFYRDHPDAYDQLVIFTDQQLVSRGTFAFESNVANEVRGIGLNIFDFSRQFGSAGRLRSLVDMDLLTRFPDDPAEIVFGPNTTLSLLGQESGHRWLAFLTFRDHTGRTSQALLGRALQHWSFFFDSEASVMEGNDIEDLGGGSFRTVAAVQRYSLLDQYAMGLVPESDVPPFFYVQDPSNTSPGMPFPDTAPRVGVSFNGTRRDVLIQDIVAVEGPRVPSAADSARVHRQAFLLVVTVGRSIDPADVAKVDRIRQAWIPFFSQATDGRMRAETRLRAGT